MILSKGLPVTIRLLMGLSSEVITMSKNNAAKDTNDVEKTLVEYISNQVANKASDVRESDDRHKDALISLLKQQFWWEHTKER